MINQELTCWDVGILKETQGCGDFRMLFGAMLDKDSWKVLGSLMFQNS